MDVKVEKFRILDDDIIMTTCSSGGKKESISFEVISVDYDKG